MDRKKCEFCNNGKDIIELMTDFGRTNSKILSTDNFYLIVSIGAITDGHILIIPKRHFLSMAELPNDLLSELKLTIEFMREYLNDVFKSPIIGFEHGTGKTEEISAASVIHAHYHLIPVPCSLLNQIKDDGYCIKELSSFKDLNINNSYLVYQDVDQKIYEILNDNFPSQYFRMLVAKKLNDNNWNWRNDFREKNVLNTLSAINKKELDTNYKLFINERKISNKIIDIIIEKFSFDKREEISINKSLKDDLGFDSIKLISLIVEIEKGFNITFPDEFLDAKHFSNIKEISKIVLDQGGRVYE